MRKTAVLNFAKSLTALMLSALVVLSAVALAVSDTVTLAAETEESGLLKAGSIGVSAENVSVGNPFARGTANGSTTFRIPGLITLNNGDLMAVADARNGGVADHGGHDTVISVSSDGGANWCWGAALNFPDSASFSAYGTSNSQTNATTIIDPLIVQGKDGTVYCTTNVVPGGISAYAGNVGAGSAFVTVGGKKRLAVTDDYAAKAFTQPTDDDLTTYPYYVGDFKNGYAEILNRADCSSTGYAIDGWFNLYYAVDGTYTVSLEGKDDLTQSQVDSETLVQQNIFYKDSVLHVYNTGYTAIMTSTDNGRTWSAPEIVDIKRTAEENYGQEEKVALISPGRGLCTSSGDIIMQVYNQNGRYSLNASILYSTDNGATWQRSNDVDGMVSSENEIVELSSGVLRMFFRNVEGVICYADITKSNGAYTVGAGQKTEVVVRSECRFSAINTSHKTESGEDIVLVSAPGTPTTRNNGKITVFAVDADNNMRVLNEYQVNEGWFAYSCLTERNDGTIALLWESNTAAFTFSVYDIDALLGNVLVDVSIGQVYTETVLSDTAKPIEQEPDENIAAVTSELETVNGYIPLYKHTTNTANSLTAFSNEFDLERTLSTAEFTLKASGTGWTVYNECTNTYLTNATNSSTFFTAASSTMLVTPTADSSTEFTIRRSNNTRYVVFNPQKMVFDATVGDTATSCDYGFTFLEKKDTVSDGDPVPGYQKVTEITDGKNYLIAYIFEDSVIVLYPINGLSNQTKLVGEATDITTNTVTVTGISNGNTTAVIGGTLYKITCHLDENETLDNMPPRIEGIVNGGTYYGSQTVTVTDKYMRSVAVNGTPVTQFDVRPDETVNSYTLNFDKTAYDYQTVSGAAGRDVVGVTGGTGSSKIYCRAEGIDSTGAIKWANATASNGIVLGKATVAGSGLDAAYILEPDRRFTVEFHLKHTAGAGITVSLMGISAYNDTEGLVLASETLSTTNSAWTKYSFTFTVPDAETIGENQYLAVMMTKPEELEKYTVLMDNLTLAEIIPGTRADEVTLNYTLSFDKTAYDYQTVSGAAGRDVAGVTGGTGSSKIYCRAEGIDSTGAIKWANATATNGIVLGKAAVTGSGLSNALTVTPQRKYTVEFYLKHTAGAGITVSLMGISAYSDTEGLVLASETLSATNTAWTKYSFTFTAPDAETIGENQYLAVMMVKPDSLAKYTVLMDNLTLTEVTPGNASAATVQSVTLQGGEDKTYTVTATDLSGNKTEYTVYMKPAEDELDMLDFGSIRYESGTGKSYLSAGVRYKGRVFAEFREQAEEIGFVAVPSKLLGDKTVAEYVSEQGNQAVTGKVKAQGLDELIYETAVDANGRTYYDYQLIITKLTCEGKTANLLDTEITVAMYAVVGDRTVYGETKAFSYNDVLTAMQDQ